MNRLKTGGMMRKLSVDSRETLRKLEKMPGFPKPVYDDGSPVKFWIEAEVDEYIRRQAEARDRANEGRQPHPIAA